MAGQVSGEINANLLILNHISPKADYFDQKDGTNSQLSLIQKAKAASKGISEVIVGYDFMEVLVPWLGFGNVEEPSGLMEMSTIKTNGDELVDAKKVVEAWFGTKAG